MSFDPSSYSNYDLMTSYHAQPNAPFDSSTYDNSNLMMSSYGAYSDMANIKADKEREIELKLIIKQLELKIKIAELTMKMEQDELNMKIEQDELNMKIEQDELNNINIQPIIKSSARNYAAPIQSRKSGQKSMKAILDEKIGINDTSVKPIIRSSVKGFLSKMDRKHVKKINNNHLTALMNAGDRAVERGDFIHEMLYHRSVQETMSRKKENGGNYQLDYRYTDPESQQAFGYNSCRIHFPEYTEYYYSLGYKFDDIFKQKTNSPPGKYKLIKGEEYEKDAKAIDYLNQSRAKDTRNQLDMNQLDMNNNTKSKPTRRGKRGGKRHKKTINEYAY